MEVNDPMGEYYEVFGHKLPPLPRELEPSDFYTPSDAQHDRESVFITLSMIAINGILWWLESHKAYHAS